MMQKKSHTWRIASAGRHAVAEDGSFLHMGGEVNTSDRDYAWIGTRDQFNNLPIDHEEYTLTRTDQ